MTNVARTTRPVAGLVLGISALAALIVPSPSAAAMADEDEDVNMLATSLFADERTSLYPIDVSVDILPLDHDTDDASVHREVVLSDGQWTSFHHAVETPAGVHAFELDLSAHHHARAAIELEYDLRVRETPYVKTTVGAYVLHRLKLGPAPVLGEPRLKVSRADIVETRGTPVRKTVTIGDRRYEVRLSAVRLRG